MAFDSCPCTNMNLLFLKRIFKVKLVSQPAVVHLPRPNFCMAAQYLLEAHMYAQLAPK